MVRMSLVPLVVLVLVVLSPAASASPILVNGSFESGPPMNGFQDVDVLAGSNVIPGWEVFGVSIDYLGPPWDVADGVHAVDLDGRNATFSGVRQTFATVSGQTYVVGFDLSGNPVGGPVVKNVRVNVDGFTQDYAFDVTGLSLDALMWQPIGLSFVAPGTSSTLSFMSLQATPNSYGPLIDNASVTPVPEPSTWLLVSSGLVAVYRHRKRVQRSA